MDRPRRRLLAFNKEIKMEISNNIFVNKFENYDKIKPFLVDAIRSSPGQKFVDVTKTDWDGGHNHNRNSNYWKILSPFVETSFNNVKQHLYKEYAEYMTTHYGYVWYQIYGYDSFHSFHTHPGCSFSNVFFVNLPNQIVQTDFVGLNNPIHLEEGDMVTFPSYLLHRSPKNPFTEDKIVVAFNISFDCTKKFDY